MTRLGGTNLAHLPPNVAVPAYDRQGLGRGIVHLGLGAFHRAHQAVYTDDAIAAAGGAWGITAVSMRRPAVRDALAAQGNLYTVEFLGETPAYRVVGAIRAALFAPDEPSAVLAALAAPTTHVVTLTVTEAGYGPGDLDDPPRSTVGWLVRGLAERRRADAGPVTVLSCDNLRGNGARLEASVLALAERIDPALPAWIAANASFPSTVVDCIVPASDAAHRARVAAVLGLADRASVQREAFSQWVIEDRFAGPRPAWELAGVEFVASVAGHERLKLHVLNAVHSTLAALGLPRGFTLVRQAMADAELARFVDAMVAQEIAPALPDLAAQPYWRSVRARLANPRLDHRLAQIAQDGPAKIAERIAPILADNRRTGRPFARLAAVVAAVEPTP